MWCCMLVALHLSLVLFLKFDVCVCDGRAQARSKLTRTADCLFTGLVTTKLLLRLSLRSLKRTLMVRLHERDGIGMICGVSVCIPFDLIFFEV
jgi:hypothetical protein